MTLREALSQVPDPRAHNRRYPLWGLLALILLAFLSRVDSLRGVARFARAHPHLLPHLGLRKPPGHTALTELLHRLDPQALAQALAAVFPETEREGERVLVADGKVLRGSGKGKSPQVRLVEVWAHSLGRTLAQARAEGSEHRALLELLERLGAEGLAGKVVVGDAGFLYPEVARGVRAKGGEYLLVLKGNQGELLGWVREVLAGMAEGALPGETRAVWEREGDGEVRRTEGYALTSLGPNEADAGVLGRLWLGRWGVENGSFWVRDVLLREDASQVRGRGGEVLAVLRAHLVSWLNRKGIRRKKAALEAFSFNPMAALRFLGLYAV